MFATEERIAVEVTCFAYQLIIAAHAHADQNRHRGKTLLTAVMVRSRSITAVHDEHVAAEVTWWAYRSQTGDHGNEPGGLGRADVSPLVLVDPDHRAGRERVLS